MTIRSKIDIEPVVGGLYHVENPSKITEWYSHPAQFRRIEISENAVIMFLGWEVVHVGDRGVIHLRARFLGPEETIVFIIVREVYIGCQTDFATNGALERYLDPRHEVWRGYFYIRGGIRPV